jgi:hypothetical protein
MRHYSTHTENVCSSLYFGTDVVLNTIRHTFYMMKSEILLCFAHKQESKQDRLDCSSVLLLLPANNYKARQKSEYTEQASTLVCQAKHAHGRWLEISSFF